MIARLRRIRMKETTVMDKITEEMMEHVCDKICRFPWEISDQEEMDEICAGCKTKKYVGDILDTYNGLNDFGQIQRGDLLARSGAEQEKHRWIPVEEQLPEEFERVLVTGQYGDVHTAYWDAEGWHLAINGLLYACCPLVWMLLPEPYEPIN